MLEQRPGRVVLEIILHEGRNRQIRNMCEQLGLEVARLKRVAIGPVKLGMLQPGQYRELTKEELRSLTASSAKAERRNRNEQSEKVAAARRAAQKGGKGYADHSSNGRPGKGKKPAGRPFGKNRG